jgi:glucose uptake protein
MLMLVGRIGIGAGFTIAQMCVVVNALIGIVVFREPPPRTGAARRTLIGVVLATIGAIVLGNLKTGV